MSTVEVIYVGIALVAFPLNLFFIVIFIFAFVGKDKMSVVDRRYIGTLDSYEIKGDFS